MSHGRRPWLLVSSVVAAVAGGHLGCQSPRDQVLVDAEVPAAGGGGGAGADARDGVSGPADAAVDAAPAAADAGATPGPADASPLPAPETPYRVKGTATTGAFPLLAADGNEFYAAGSFQGSLDFGGTVLTSTPTTSAKDTDGKDGFLARFDAAGKLLWVKKFFGPFLDRARDLGVAPNGDAVLLGDFGAGQMTFEQITLVGSSTPDSQNTFAARVSPAGKVIWATRPDVYIGGIGFNVEGNPVLGTSYGMVYKTLNQDGAVVASVRAAGTPAAGMSLLSVQMLKTDRSFNLYVFGYFSGTLQFPEATVGPRTLTSAGAYDLVLIKYGPDSKPIWATPFGTAMSDTNCEDIKLDADGNPFLGFYLGNDATLARYDARTGTQVWSKSFMNPLGGLEIDARGDVLATFRTPPDVDLGAGPIQAASVLGRFAGATGTYLSLSPFSSVTVTSIVGLSSGDLVGTTAPGAVVLSQR
jgi:outer membrane protein assembly factor BamB